MHINSQFDSGNINVISIDDPSNIQLSINKDHQSDFHQWFHFKLHTTPFINHKMTIVDADKTAYPEGWQDYKALASYDRETWFRVDTEYTGKSLVIDFTPEYESVYFAYFIPYSYERHQDLIGSAQMSFDCRHELLGLTIDGREVNLLIIGDEPQEGDDPKNIIWVTARQHPGETMAEWLVEGMLDRLLDEDDGLAKELLSNNVFYVVPNMNPDGSVRGHLRTNAVGVNLNREWESPSLDQSPEVYYVLKKMQETGVDIYLDVHGDEALPYNFVAGSEGIPNYTDKIKTMEDTFKKALLDVTPEFQDKYGYDKDEPGKANLTVASNAVSHKFDCLGYTLEMPFKDNANLPDAAFGWSTPRCKQLGQDVLVAFRAVSQYLLSRK
jgi:murein tripeptide amidase MpaA